MIQILCSITKICNLYAFFLYYTSSLGFRLLLLSIPFAFFGMGAWGLLVSTVVLVFYLFLFDFKYLSPATGKDL
jgi:hypothetical protein